MTFNAGHEDLRLEGDYVKLEAGGARSADAEARPLKETPPCGCARAEFCRLLWRCAKLVSVLFLVLALLAVFLKWVGPFFMNKVIFSLLDQTSCFCSCWVLQKF